MLPRLCRLVLGVSVATLSVVGTLAHVPHDSVTALAISPRFASDGHAWSSVRGGLFRTIDGGQSWQFVIPPGGPTDSPAVILFSANYPEDRRMFFGSGRGLYRTADAGASWIGCGGLASLQIRAATLVPRVSQEPTVLAIDHTGQLHRSENACESWTTIETGVEPLSAVHGTGALALAGARDGRIAMSRDAGTTWSVVGQVDSAAAITCIADVPGAPGEALVGTAGHGVHHLRTIGSSVHIRPAGLAASHVTSLASGWKAGRVVVFATSWNDAVWYTADLGRTWSKRGRGLRRNRQAEEYGKPEFSHVQLGSDGTLLLGGFCGLARSDDEGRNWIRLETQSMRHGVGLVVAPIAGGRTYLGVATYAAGFYESRDGGTSWTSRSRGLMTRTGDVLAVPGYPGSGSLLTGSFQNVLRLDSGTDRWETFRLAAPDPAKSPIAPWQFPVVWRTAGGRGPGEVVFAGCYAYGVIRSRDGGTTFEEVWDSGGKPIWGLAVSPAFDVDRTLFASTGQGLFRSGDGGDTWDAIGGDSAPAAALLEISPAFAEDGTIYAGTRDGLRRSRDRGGSWSRVDLGRGAEAVLTMTISPRYADDRLLLVFAGRGPLQMVRDGSVGVRVDESENREYAFVHNAGRDRGRLLEFSPGYPEDGTIYGLAERHVVISRDVGKSWTRIPFPVRYEAETALSEHFTSPLVLDGTWEAAREGRFSGTGTLRASTPGARAEFQFAGRGVRIVSGPSGGGRARVRLDDEPATEVEWEASTVEGESIVYEAEPAPGLHRLTIEVLSEPSRPFAAEPWVDIDVVEVFH